MRSIGKINGEILSSGVFAAFDAQSAPLYTDASNILFADQLVQPFPNGSLVIASGQSAPILGLEAVRISGLRKLFYGTGNGLFSWDVTNGNVQHGTGYSRVADQTTLANASTWSILQWGDWVLATNGIDAPQIWKGSSFGALSGLGSEFATAKTFVKWRQYLFAVNLDVGNNRIAWCDTNDVEDWVPTASNDAGALFIRDMESEIIAARLLQDNLLLYGHNSVYGINFLQSRQVFGSQHLLTGIGAYSQHAVTSFQGKHYGFGPRGIWVSDGVSFDYIHTPAVKDTVLNNVNEDQASKIIAYHDARLDCLIFFYPTLGSTNNDAGLAFNYKTNSWNPLDLARSAATDNGVFSYPVTGSVSGSLYNQSAYELVATPTVDSSIAVPATFAMQFGYGGGAYGGVPPYGGNYNGVG
tara:strand:+ start:11649 stop:12884 length:1236 start_codon:yes stop_codon:yes gene_type:complete